MLDPTRRPCTIPKTPFVIIDSRCTMKMNRCYISRQSNQIFLVLLLALGLATCAGSKTHWLRLRLHPVGEEGAKANVTIGVLPFEDGRTSTKRLGQRVLRSGKEEPIRLESASAAKDVTNILHRILKARKIRMVELSHWDAAPKNLKDLPEEVDVAIAGRIMDLAVEAQSFTVKTTVRYRVKLSAQLGLRRQGKMVMKAVEVNPEETTVRFNPQKVQESLNEAVATALGQIVDVAISSSK